MSEEKAKEVKKQEDGRASGKKALLFELENIVFNRRAALFDLLKKGLKERDKELSVPLFSRYCIEKTPRDFIPELLSALDITSRSNEKFIKEIEDGMAEYWDSEKLG